MVVSKWLVSGHLQAQWWRDKPHYQTHLQANVFVSFTLHCRLSYGVRQINQTKPFGKGTPWYQTGGQPVFQHRNGNFVRVTAVIFTGDVEAFLQRRQWISGLSTWRCFRFSEWRIQLTLYLHRDSVLIIYSYVNMINLYNDVYEFLLLITWSIQIAGSDIGVTESIYISSTEMPRVQYYDVAELKIDNSSRLPIHLLRVS